MRCNKCGGKIVTIDGRVSVQVGDSSFTTITDVGHCNLCNVQTIKFQYKIEPLMQIAAKKDFIDREEREHNA